VKIVVAGHHRERTGYGELARLLALSLEGGEHEVVSHPLLTRHPPSADIVLTVSTAEEFWRCRVEGAKHIGFTMIERAIATGLEVRLIDLVDAVIVPSEWNRRAFRDAGVAVPTYVVHPPLDPALTHSPWPIAHAPSFTFLSVFEWGRPHKDPHSLIQAFHQAFKGLPGVVLQLRTNPPPGEDLGPGVEVVPPLHRADLLELMSQADAYVATSRAEGWGLPAFESIALGVPVIATNFGGALEYMNSSNTLLVAPLGLEKGRAVLDVPAMAHAMRRVHEAGRRPRQPPEDFREMFSLERTREALLAVFSAARA